MMENVLTAEGSQADGHLPREHNSEVSVAQEVIQLMQCPRCYEHHRTILPPGFKK